MKNTLNQTTPIYELLEKYDDLIAEFTTSSWGGSIYLTLKDGRKGRISTHQSTGSYQGEAKYEDFEFIIDDNAFLSEEESFKYFFEENESLFLEIQKELKEKMIEDLGLELEYYEELDQELEDELYDSAKKEMLKEFEFTYSLEELEDFFETLEK